ncbi:MAG: gfo/Idh/MocA family oxidoreductase, partial [Bacteroidota bacterium]
MHRRTFIQNTSKISLAAGAWAVAPEIFAKPTIRQSANEKIVIGAIGVNGMGNAIMSLALKEPNVE